MTIVRKLLFLFIFTLTSMMINAQTSPGVPLFLSDNHAMYRLTADATYLLLPIEEKEENANVNLVVSNETAQTFNVKLAVDHIDYFVPLDISRYKGRQVLLDIGFNANRRTTGDIKDYSCWKELKTASTFDTANREKFRPQYHHTPDWGWMNDPNGLFYKDGVYHLYFQHNPYGSQWENMSWGHSTSRDLIHWEHQPEAIMPDALGTIFSGCCVVDKNNTAGFGANAVIAIYTSAGRSQTQSLAYSTDDGRTFTKYDRNPIITSNVPDFRDPHVFWNEDTKQWNLILAAGQEMNIYTSDNLKDWTYASSFGHGYGNHDGVWECPDLVKLPVRGTNEYKWVLICNINPGGPFGGNATQYFVGQFDGHKFTCESKPEVTKWMDYGKDHYAAITFDNAPEGRNLLLGWMSNWQYANNVPTKQYRSANTLPRDMYLFNDGGETYVGVEPAKELLALRDRAVVKASFTLGSKTFKQLFKNPTGVYEIVADIAPATGSKLGLVLSNSKGEKVTMTYNTTDKTFSMDRAKSGDTTFNEAFPAMTVAPVKGGGIKRLRIFVDNSSIEVFEADGRMAMTNLVFPAEPYNTLTLTSDGRCKVNSFTVYSIKK